MIVELAEKLPWFQGENSRCRCFAHVINLIVKSILGQFEGRKGKQNSPADQDTRSDGFVAEFMSDDEESAVESEEDGEDVEENKSGEDEESEEDGDEEEGEQEVEPIDVAGLDTGIQPVGSMLSKVSQSFAYMYLYNSHTLFLLQPFIDH